MEGKNTYGHILLRIIGKLKYFFSIYTILEMPVAYLVVESSLDWTI